ncbi:MAG: type I-C CRISPR-associated protein Cas5c [Pyrinomonadaceae bacterium]|nr:type I-C CRISPR-associated protein Cas5c [Pyrinomonadaceae bacterium]MDW8305425.1 type I-C CRISPR-associated protein Cas5c [Acidobacteriota bacterium]
MKELISLRVWGRLACFTRPEMKVERVSYPLMTPSSARGILEAILWKPEVYYVIDSIRVIKRGQWTHFKRNEIQSRISFSQAKSAMLGRGRLSVIEAGAGSSDATPRNTLALRDVEYIISAEVKLTELGETAGEPLQKYLEEFKRRAKLGKCFHRPCLGMREFDAEFDLVEKVDDFQPEQNWTEDLGLMLYDLFLPEDRRIGFKFIEESEETLLLSRKRKPTKGMLPTPSPLFFHAKVENSVMDCNPSRVKIYGGKRKNVT